MREAAHVVEDGLSSSNGVRRVFCRTNASRIVFCVTEDPGLRACTLQLSVKAIQQVTEQSLHLEFLTSSCEGAKVAVEGICQGIVGDEEKLSSGHGDGGFVSYGLVSEQSDHAQKRKLGTLVSKYWT